MTSMKVVSIGGGDPLRVPTLLRELETRYLVWDAFVAGQRRVDLHPIVLPRALHERAIGVAESVMRDVGAVASRAHADPNERALYRLPKAAERLAEASAFARDDASLVRVDLPLRRGRRLPRLRDQRRLPRRSQRSARPAASSRAPPASLTVTTRRASSPRSRAASPISRASKATAPPWA